MELEENYSLLLLVLVRSPGSPVLFLPTQPAMKREKNQTRPSTLEHYLEFRQRVLIDNHESLLLSAEAMDLTSVDIEPEGVDVNPAVLVRSHEGIAGDVLHLEQGIHHGQLVGDAEFFIDINVGRELGVLVKLVEKQRLPEVSLQ